MLHSHMLMLIPVGAYLLQASCLLDPVTLAHGAVCRQGWWSRGLSGVSSILCGLQAGLVDMGLVWRVLYLGICSLQGPVAQAHSG